MARDVYVAGVGMLPFTKPGTSEPYHVMGANAMRAALNDAGLDYDKVQQVYAGYVYGDSCSGQKAAYEVGLTGIPVINVNNNCSTGSTALFLARQAVASGVNLTYKILYNDAVAMTGGQPIDGPISVAQITHELRGEAISTIAVVSSDPTKFNTADFATGTRLYHRDELETVQTAMRDVPGVSVIIYEQTSATELRRRRGKKLAPDPARRVVINERVCEGCGDCRSGNATF